MTDLDLDLDLSAIPRERQASLTAEYGDPTTDPAAFRERVYAERGSAPGFADEVAAAIRANREARALGKPVPHSAAAIADLSRAALAANPASDAD